MHHLKLAIAGLAGVGAFALSGCREPAHKTAGTPPAAQTAVRPPPPPPPPPLAGQDAVMALETLERAPGQGFSAARFHAGRIARLLGSSTPAERTEGERQLRAAILDYARAQHGLTIPTGALPRAWRARPSTYDAEGELNAAIRGGTMREWLDGLPPQSAAYQALQAAYAAAKAEPAKPRLPEVEAAPLDIGEQDDRTEALRKRLTPEEPQLADAPVDAPVDEDLIAALTDYQRGHGLEPTGVLDAPTLARLNAREMGEPDKLRVNMERLRWLPRPEPARRIDVNTAAAEMDYIRDGEVATHMLAVSGKRGDETPLVSSAIDSIVLNPPWYVPSDIARREILPKGAAYMRARNFVWRDGRLIQRPGPKAALGRVKFDFPNPYAVYLHDTPTKATFSQTRRTASHGCVRLERAVQLARILADEEPGSSAGRVDKILASGRTARLKLSRAVPVRLMYLTAVPRDDTVAFVPDVYGWDPELLGLLDRYGGARRR